MITEIFYILEKKDFQFDWCRYLIIERDGNTGECSFNQATKFKNQENAAHYNIGQEYIIIKVEATYTFQTLFKL